MRDTTWFENDRFGMFVHFGLYSTAGGVWEGRKITHPYSEWLQASERVPRVEYRKLAERFNPKAFDADVWIREAAGAGMKYFLITAKHHDGFCLWPTKASAYNVMDATPFKRDILGELAQACTRHGVKLGFYYSHWLDWDGTGGDVDWAVMENAEYVHPTQAQFEAYWQRKCLVQVRELIERYDPWCFWFDTWNEKCEAFITPRRQDELIGLVHGLSAKCLVNSRIRFLTPSDQCDTLSMMDNTFPEKGFAKPWETSGTLNHSWAYHQLDYDWKPTVQLLKNLVGNAALGGNYQLNVGPMPDGRFQEAAIKRLREIGCWMAVNGEAIHGTRTSPVGAMPWGRVTMRALEDGNTRLYLHLWDYTPGTALIVPGLTDRPLGARVLETGQPVAAEAGTGGLWVAVPKELRGIVLPVIALDVLGNNTGRRAP